MVVRFLLMNETATTGTGMSEFVSSIIAGVTGEITLASVATVVASIIGAGIVGIFAWKFARKGYAFVKNALSGKGGRI